MAQEWQVEVQRLDGRIDAMQATLQSHDQKWTENRDTHATLFKGLGELDKALNTRLPVWATFLIGGLMSAVTGLGVALLK